MCRTRSQRTQCKAADNAGRNRAAIAAAPVAVALTRFRRRDGRSNRRSKRQSGYGAGENLAGGIHFRLLRSRLGMLEHTLCAHF
jgi:hypothetical protein